MMRERIIIACMFLMVVYSGCASQAGTTGLKNDTVELKAQMAMLQQTIATSADVDSLLSYLVMLEALVRKQTDLLWSMRADLNSRISNLDNRLQVLDAKITESDRLFSTLSQKMEGVKAQLSTRVPLDTAISRPAEPNELYNTALADYQRGNYALAISQFSQYLQYFPDTELADNAQYWIGDCYYTQKEYTQALDAYEMVLSEYPKGNKVPAALLKVGFTRLVQNDTAGGRAYLERVMNEFPESEEAKLARMRLGTLPGK